MCNIRCPQLFGTATEHPCWCCCNGRTVPQRAPYPTVYVHVHVCPALYSFIYFRSPDSAPMAHIHPHRSWAAKDGCVCICRQLLVCSIQWVGQKGRSINRLTVIYSYLVYPCIMERTAQGVFSSVVLCVDEEAADHSVRVIKVLRGNDLLRRAGVKEAGLLRELTTGVGEGGDAQVHNTHAWLCCWRGKRRWRDG